MQKEIRESLKGSIADFMEENSINWGNIQKANIKEIFGCPVGWRTLWKIIKLDSYSNMHVNKQSKLLAFFGTKHQKTFGVIKLKENETKENNSEAVPTDV